MKYTVLLVFGLLSYGCGPHIVYEKSYLLEDNIWEYDELLPFEWEISDTSAHYQFLLTLDHSVNYPYENLYTKIETKYPDGTQLQDTLSIEMCSQPGLWAADCRGDLCTLKVGLQEKVKFDQQGIYQLSLEQFTRDSILTGIHAIAFEVRRVL